MAAFGGEHNDEAVWRACANAAADQPHLLPLLPPPLFASAAAATAIAAKVRALVVGAPSAAPPLGDATRSCAAALCAAAAAACAMELAGRLAHASAPGISPSLRRRLYYCSVLGAQRSAGGPPLHSAATELSIGAGTLPRRSGRPGVVATGRADRDGRSPAAPGPGAATRSLAAAGPSARLFVPGLRRRRTHPVPSSVGPSSLTPVILPAYRPIARLHP